MDRRTRTFAVFGLVLLAPPVLNAQATVRVGPMVGFNLSDLRTSSEDAPNIDHRNGFLAGGFLSIGVTPRFAIQPELLYTQKGAKLPIDDGVTGSIKLAYIQVPVLAQVRFPGANAVPYLFAGPALGIEAGCKVQAEAGSASLEQDCDDSGIDLKSTDFSGIVGVGIEVAGLSIAARYDHGFSSIDGDSGDVGTYNRAFSFTVGYGFRVGPR